MSLLPSLSAVATFVVLCTAAYYLFARAEVTRPLWSRYRGVLDRAARCPACSGFWIGALWGAVLGPRADLVDFARGVGLGACWGLVVTPLGTWAMVSALAATTIPDEPPAEEPVVDEPGA